MADESRPTVLLLPGLLCDDFTFAAARGELEAVADIVVPDFRGLDSIGAMAERTLEAAPYRFAVAGFSMGGRVAFDVIRRAPERVVRFCVFDTGLAPAAAGEAERRQVLIDLGHAEGMAAVAQAWLPPMLHPAHRGDAAIVAPLTAMVGRFTPEDFEKQIRALLTRPDARPVPATIRCPSLVLCGAQDEWSPPAQNRAIAESIPGSAFHVVEGAGHFLPVEQPQGFAAALRAWLAIPA